jgi:hypothetical protein
MARRPSSFVAVETVGRCAMTAQRKRAGVRYRGEGCPETKTRSIESPSLPRTLRSQSLHAAESVSRSLRLLRELPCDDGGAALVEGNSLPVVAGFGISLCLTGESIQEISGPGGGEPERERSLESAPQRYPTIIVDSSAIRGQIRPGRFSSPLPERSAVSQSDATSIGPHTSTPGPLQPRPELSTLAELAPNAMLTQRAHH